MGHTDNDTLKAALAGLLVDPRLRQAIAQYIPRALADYDERGRAETARFADLLTSGGGRSFTGDSSRLKPILAGVQLLWPAPVDEWRHRRAALEVENYQTTYPAQDEDGNDVDPWHGLRGDLEIWKDQQGWDTQPAQAYLTTFLALLRKHLWCVVAAAQTPDVSLYDHLRVTSALTTCLTQGVDIAKAKADRALPLALIVRGDLSGIQKFIYRITRPEAETEHVAKRLRGRSFYLAVLLDVAADWLLRELALPQNNALFVGGGRFDLMVPITRVGDLQQRLRRLNEWLLDEFNGELSLQVAQTSLAASDIADMRGVYRGLDEQLERSKHQKWRDQLNNERFFEPSPQGWHTCNVCRLTPLPETHTCDLCKQHHWIGHHLPHATHLAYCYGLGHVGIDSDQWVTFRGNPFGVRVAIVRSNTDLNHLLQSSTPLTLYRLNSTSDFIHAQAACSFRFLANIAPRATTKLAGHGIDPIDEDDILHFEALSELSTGAKRFGALKADVDRLGLIMGEGLSDDDTGQRPTMPRVAALSSILDVFFAGHINRICQEVFLEWQKTTDHEWANQVDGLFYMVYSGGDDLFVAGPWDAVLKLAERLNLEFARFSGYNPNLTLSAGFAQVKPRYPAQKLAELVNDAEIEAKDSGRNRIGVFGQVAVWRSPDNGFDVLRQLADDLCEALRAKEIPRGLIVDLGQVYRQHTDKESKLSNPMWTPRLFYSMSRRLSGEMLDRFGMRLIRAMEGGRILVPVSIVSLITRKE